MRHGNALWRNENVIHVPVHSFPETKKIRIKRRSRKNPFPDKPFGRLEIRSFDLSTFLFTLSTKSPQCCGTLFLFLWNTKPLHPKESTAFSTICTRGVDNFVHTSCFHRYCPAACFILFCASSAALQADTYALAAARMMSRCTAVP